MRSRKKKKKEGDRHVSANAVNFPQEESTREVHTKKRAPVEEQKTRSLNMINNQTFII
jgi:hypothetical protein